MRGSVTTTRLKLTHLQGERRILGWPFPLSLIRGTFKCVVAWSSG